MRSFLSDLGRTLPKLLPRLSQRWRNHPLGSFEPQYPPRPLQVPSTYLRSRPPPDPPTISIVTPTLNQAEYVRTCLESVLQQGYPRLEYAVMDGGSEDGTRDVLDGYRHRLHRLRSGFDSGQAGAIDAGFRESSGEIMSWLNSDDLLLPGTLAYVASYFERHPEVDLVYGHRVLLDELGRDVGIWVTPPHCRASLRWYGFVPQETAFWRRRLWERAGGIDERYRVAFDWELFLRFQALGARIVRLPRFLGAFRIHPGQRSRLEREQALAEIDAIRERWNGRHVSIHEARLRAVPFRLRSISYLAWYRGMARLPVPRVPAAPSIHHTVAG